jgi:ribosomal-protein-alanine N-acetyltransferase
MKFNFTPFPNILTERLTLRQVTSNDCSEILFLRSDKEVNTFIKRAAPSNLKDAELFLDKISKGIKSNELVCWGISLKENPKMIGSICLWNFSTEANKAEVGYDLNPQFQNLGIMSEALKAVLEYGFKSLELNDIEAFTHFKNEHSVKLLKKNGFKLVLNKKDKDNLNNIVFSIKNHRKT